MGISMDLYQEPLKNNKLKNSPQISLEEKDGEKKTLLPSAVAGEEKKPKRRVKWNDDRGEKLVQVFEFFPSDSSDSEDEYIDSSICTIM